MFNKHHTLNGVLFGSEQGENFPLTGIGMKEPISIMKELRAEVDVDFTIILILDGVRDNYAVIDKRQRSYQRLPATKSVLNTDGIFEFKWRMEALIVKHGINSTEPMTKGDFCDTPNAKKIFDGVWATGVDTPLDAVLQVLEIRLSRTDSGNFINYIYII